MHSLSENIPEQRSILTRVNENQILCSRFYLSNFDNLSAFLHTSFWPLLFHTLGLLHSP